MSDTQQVSTTGQHGFHWPEQNPPGANDLMTPTPDHGELSHQGHPRLTGLRALITGGDSGIGRAVAIAFAREGAAAVAISYLPAQQPDALETAYLIRDAGADAVLVPGDLTDPEVCKRVIDTAVSHLGGLDILINTADLHLTKGHSGTIQRLEPETVERVIRTDFEAVLGVVQAALPQLGRGSVIINTSSIQSYEPSPHLLYYPAIEAAINNPTVNLAEP